jgi:hypothetical protein
MKPSGIEPATCRFVTQCLNHYATTRPCLNMGVNLFLGGTTIRTVPGSIPGGVTGFFSDIFPSDRTMALGSTQPLVKISTRDIPGGKGGRCVRLTTSPHLRAECHEIWEPQSPGTLWATPGLLRDCCSLYFHI